jgi:N-acetylglucosaminyldiphosphoundecaprenol N-acetyl-beta-D-mannosaminyltransferase
VSAVEILGCRVDAIGRDAAVDRVIALANGTAPAVVVTLGTEMVMEAQRNPRFRAVVARAALVTCDTIGLLVASRLRGGPLRERVTGVDLVEGLASRSAAGGLRLYLLGGRGDTAARAGDVLRARGAHVVGARDGYFSPPESDAVARAIAASGANVLLAGLGSPKQELWLDQHLAATGCGVGIGVGGTLDVLAGNAGRAPHAWQRLGLEWLYRLIREPRRWRRQLALPAFAFLALRETVFVRFLNKGGT